MSLFSKSKDDVPGDLEVILGLLLLVGMNYFYIKPIIWIRDIISNK